MGGPRQQNEEKFQNTNKKLLQPRTLFYLPPFCLEGTLTHNFVVILPFQNYGFENKKNKKDKMLYTQKRKLKVFKIPHT